MTEDQTLVLYSGHPMGLFPSHPNAPRLVVTNGLTVPNYSTREDYERMCVGLCLTMRLSVCKASFKHPNALLVGMPLEFPSMGK